MIRRAANLAIFGILLLSISLNLIFFRRGQQYYRELNATRLDPLGLQSYPTEADQRDLTAPERIIVVFYGDSRAAHWPAPADLTQFDFVNRGIGAQTSTQAWLRFENHLAPLRPEIVVVQICINDLKTIPLFPDEKATIIATCQQNIDRIVGSSVDLGATVILATIFPLGPLPLERRAFWSPDVAAAVEEVNQFIWTLASDRVIIFDGYSILADDSTTRSAYAADLLHLNEAGYEALNQGLRPLLLSLEREKP